MTPEPQPPEYVLTLKGYASQLPPALRGLPSVELDPTQPFMLQLLPYPKDAQFRIEFPERLSRANRERLFQEIYVSNVTRVLSLNTYDQFFLDWAYNALDNKERILGGTPINQLKRFEGTRRAWVIGNGPSLETLLAAPPPEGTAIFCCWHAAHRVRAAGWPIHLLGHLDRIAPPQADFAPVSLEPGTPIVAFPSVAPSFLASFTDHPLYVYLSRENALNAWFARAMGSPEHGNVVGTISNLLVQAALYAGYTEIGLVGVDLAHGPVKKRPATWQQHVNACGQTVWTDDIFLAFREGLEGVIRQHPSVTFYTGSAIGLDITGCPYRAVQPKAAARV